MAIFNVKINSAAIQAKVHKAMEVRGRSVAHKRAFVIFQRAYNMMLRNFDEHPITVEILGGPKMVNLSDTLDGYGNLFSFIGFDNGSDPIGSLRSLLAQGTTFRPTVFRNQAWHFRIITPSREAIARATPMPWEGGNSWVEGIEKGMSNLSFYLYKKSEKSRSGMGIQAGWEINEDLSFKRTKYLTEILNNFRDRINNNI